MAKADEKTPVIVSHRASQTVPRHLPEAVRLVAAQLDEAGRAQAIPLTNEAELSARLAEMPSTEQVPESLFTASAAVLAAIYRLAGRELPEADQQARAQASSSPASSE